MIIMHKKEQQQQLVAIQQSIEKDNKVLKDRIERWQKFSSKKDEEIYKIKLSAARRIAALEKKSLICSFLNHKLFNTRVKDHT